MITFSRNLLIASYDSYHPVVEGIFHYQELSGYESANEVKSWASYDDVVGVGRVDNQVLPSDCFDILA